MDSLINALFQMLSFGSIMVLVVLGLGVIASMMGIFNFAQGEFVLLGAYITYLAYSRGLPIWVGMVAAPFLVGALGFVLEGLIIRRFYAAPIVAMLGTYALGLIIRESVRGLIGGFYLTVPEPIGGSIDLGSIHISAWRFTIIVITLLVMGACYLLLSRSRYEQSQLQMLSCVRHDLVRRSGAGAFKLARREIIVDQSVLGMANLAVFL